MTNIAPEIPETLSPYWLRLYGRWVHLEGIQPENDMSPGRVFSDLVTVDGYRYVQRSPRGPRTWTFPYELATAAATAALESAAYDYNYEDPSTRTLLMDRNAARVNMVPSDLSHRWATSWATTSGNGSKPGFRLKVGENADAPIWLPSYDYGDKTTASPQPYKRTLAFSMLPGVQYTVALWYAAAQVGADLIRVIKVVNGVRTQIAAFPGVNHSNPNDPLLASVTFTAPTEPSDYPTFTTTTIEVEIALTPYAAGLMVYEGNCPPDYYRPGRQMPCAVSVQDPTMTINPIFPGRNCGPCSLPRETSTFVLQEVAMDVVTPLDIGVS